MTPINDAIEVFQGDITALSVDAIVNAANSRLAGGGGVDGAIHRAAGPELLKACQLLGGCPTGDVKMTPGFQLAVKAVFHAVGPIWQGGEKGEAQSLASCYRRAMDLAAERDFASIAFSAISCGIYGYPNNQAVGIAVREVKAALQRKASVKRVIFCCFDNAMAELYRQALRGS